LKQRYKNFESRYKKYPRFIINLFICKAKNLFLQGIENEQSGRLYEAIQFYRRAVQLVPDIEFRLYESTKPKLCEKIDADEKSILEKTNKDDGVELEDLELEENDSDILGKLAKIIGKNGCLCSPHHEQSVSIYEIYQ
jgi:F-box protein 9